MIFLELMTTDGCHLCEQAVEVLQQTLSVGQAEIDLVDIVFDDSLMDRYATRIPVLVEPASGRKLGWPFDGVALQVFMSGCSDTL